MAYGYNQISTNNDNKNIYKWSVKINKSNDNVSGILIGISSEIYLEKKSFVSWQYSYIQHGRINTYPEENDGYTHRKHYGIKFKQGDIITMELDLSKSQIKYYVNNEDQGIAYKNIIRGQDIKYRLAVSLREIDNEIEIVSFTKTSWIYTQIILSKKNK